MKKKNIYNLKKNKQTTSLMQNCHVQAGGT